MLKNYDLNMHMKYIKITEYKSLKNQLFTKQNNTKM